MQKKKAVIDSQIAAAQEERGVLLVNTGNGKGKSSAAFGVVARALGHGLKVGVVQFVKGRAALAAGEFDFICITRHLPDGDGLDLAGRIRDLPALLGWCFSIPASFTSVRPTRVSRPCLALAFQSAP